MSEWCKLCDLADQQQMGNGSQIVRQAFSPSNKFPLVCTKKDILRCHEQGRYSELNNPRRYVLAITSSTYRSLNVFFNHGWCAPHHGMPCMIALEFELREMEADVCLDQLDLSRLQFQLQIKSIGRSRAGSSHGFQNRAGDFCMWSPFWESPQQHEHITRGS